MQNPAFELSSSELTECIVSQAHAAVRNGNFPLLQNFLGVLAPAQRIVVAGSRDSRGNTVLYNAVHGGSLRCVRVSIHSMGKISAANREGNTTLMVAAAKGYTEIAKYLLDEYDPEVEGTSLASFIDAQDERGRSAMHHAACANNFKVIALLKDNGGNVSIQNKLKDTPAHIAAWQGNLFSLEALLEGFSGEKLAAVLNSLNKYSQSVLNKAASGNSVECVEFVVRNGAKMSGADRFGETPLMVAAGKGRTGVVEFLLTHFDPRSEGVSKRDFLCARDFRGNDAMDVATGECALAIEKCLRRTED